MHEVYTVKRKSSLPHIVLLHGYGGTALVYVRMFKKLSQHYQVHALDIFGIGNSSLGDFKNNFTYEEARDYFINSIEAWRETMGIN